MVQTISELSSTQVLVAVNSIIDVLGTPETDAQIDALSAFHQNNHQLVKRLASTNLSDNYCKALGYLGGALKLTPNTDTILAEAARAAAEVAKERTLKQLSSAIADALN